MGGDECAELVEPLRAAVDHLLEAPLTSLASTQVTELLRDLEVQRRRLAAVDQRVLTEAGQRGLAGDYARASTVDLLVDMLRVAPAEAKARVAQAQELQSRTTLTGAVVPPVLPRCAVAVRAGEISAAHVSVIAKTIERIPANIAHEAAPVAEQMLVDAARHQHAAALAQTAALLLVRLDPDGTKPRDDEAERRRNFTICRRGDGTGRVTGEWTAELAAMWDAILSALSAPLPAPDGVRDERSPAQRRHDAMIEAGTRLLRSGDLPASGGSPVTVLLRMRPGDLADDGGVAQTANGDIWPAARVRANLADATIVPIGTDHSGAVLFCGRRARLATPGQRLALAARDGGCCFPGCARPAAWTEAHHIREWEAGGRTDIDNLCLLCRYHHREFSRCGWTVEMADGVPQWIPPPFIDLERRPVRNTVHHLPDIDFATDVDVSRAG